MIGIRLHVLGRFLLFAIELDKREMRHTIIRVSGPEPAVKLIRGWSSTRKSNLSQSGKQPLSFSRQLKIKRDVHCCPSSVATTFEALNPSQTFLLGQKEAV